MAKALARAFAEGVAVGVAEKHWAADCADFASGDSADDFEEGTDGDRRVAHSGCGVV
ncbi:hypothetical protein GCM10019016_013290 [Streptomyces prasinosporus]|uniref:Transposase n=1 Tax=Streptomyces prasinosporus TaxID=68256 RepID=A0ABP6TGF0_9ACTN|nr:hypothetical protein GCM10010332_72380 [Streptomyces albogriseolus]